MPTLQIKAFLTVIITVTSCCVQIVKFVMYVFWEFGTVFMEQNILPLTEYHRDSARGSSFHRKYILGICWDVQGAPQCCSETPLPAVKQPHLHVTSALGHSVAPGAVSTHCSPAWKLLSNALNLEMSVIMWDVAPTLTIGPLLLTSGTCISASLIRFNDTSHCTCLLSLCEQLQSQHTHVLFCSAAGNQQNRWVT